MLSKVLNIGIRPDLDFYQKREIKILNTLTLVILFGLLVGSSNVFFLGDSYPALAELLIALSSASILYFNKKEMYELASYLFVIIINCTVFFVSQYYDDSTDTYLYYFPIIICIALLHNPNKAKYRSLSFFLIILFSFLTSRLLDIPALNNTTFTKQQNHLLFLYNIYFCIILTIALIYMFIRMLDVQYKELSELVYKTKNDQALISKTLKEKELLLSEIQHRVKNNLAVIIALFNFQKDATTNKEVIESLVEAKNRVLSIAMVHEQLYRKDNLSKINLEKYFAELVQEILRSHPLYSKAKIETNLVPVHLEITKTVPLGLIANEIVTNSLKHGFKNNIALPQISISLTNDSKQITLIIKDNGIGFPMPIQSNNNSLGISLMESLASQIDATIEFSNNNGAHVKIQLSSI